VYIPLGGNRCSKGRNFLNIFIVWTLTGLWHGANLTFLVWGWFNFIILIIEKGSGIAKKKGRVIHVFTWFYTIFILLLEAILFRSTSLTHAFNYFKTAFGWNAIAFSDGQFTGWLSQNLIVLTVCILLSTPVFPWLSERFRENGIAKIIGVTALCMLFALSVFSLVSNSYNPFIYFNF
jgi:D-alanyl-lipoteichoic acid acyltransferase DltB (MBOAT superfamily)